MWVFKNVIKSCKAIEKVLNISIVSGDTMSEGQLITIEGIDKAGKSTVIRKLRERYPDAEYTTEPDDSTWVGKQVRRGISSDNSVPSCFEWAYSRLKTVFTDEECMSLKEWMANRAYKQMYGETTDVPPLTVFFLFLADHANHLESVIGPALEDGENVICDRYTDSRYAYQMVALEDSVDDSYEFIRQVQEYGSWSREPDLTILLDLPIAEYAKRAEGNDDEIFENSSFQEKVRNNYLEISEKYNDRVEVVDASMSKEEVVDTCLEIVEEQLEN